MIDLVQAKHLFKISINQPTWNTQRINKAAYAKRNTFIAEKKEQEELNKLWLLFLLIMFEWTNERTDG